MERPADEAEEAARRQDLKTLYIITKTLSGRYINSERPVKDKEDNIIFSEADKNTRWKENVQTILNRPEPYVIADIPAAREDLDINIDASTMEEVKAAIKEMKSGKAAGVDGVTAEMLKAEETETPRLLTEIFINIWESEETSETWKTGLIVKLPKKGDLSDCDNWRRITLLSLTSKVFNKIIYKRLAETLDEHIRQDQATFRTG